MNKITLIVTSWNPNEALLNKMLQSAKGFDEVVLHIDSETEKYPHVDVLAMHDPLRLETYDQHLGVGDAYNLLINRTSTEWVCCMCDDDYFDAEGLAKAIALLDTTSEDVIHFPVHVFGDCAPHVWGANHVTKESLERNNRIPAASFFRKTAWEKAGGFKGDIYHDWVLWLRMLKAGCTFKYLDSCVYHFQLRQNSAAIRQQKDLKEDPRSNVLRFANA